MRTLLVVLLLAFAVGSMNAAGTAKPKKHTTKVAKKKSVAKVTYQCPMDTDVTSSKPGTCPKCGMDLVKVEPKKK